VAKNIIIPCNAFMDKMLDAGFWILDSGFWIKRGIHFLCIKN